MTDAVLNIYGVILKIAGPEAVLLKLRRDFAYFLSDQGADIVYADNVHDEFYNIELFNKNPDLSILENKKKLFLPHKEFTMYRASGVKYIDYLGKALSVYDHKSKKVEIGSLKEDLLYELGYLSVLSFFGEEIERKKIFRIHAFSALYKEKGFLLMSPSGGGKTYQMLNLLKNEDIRFFSDDLTLLDNEMSLLPFPIRIGVLEKDRRSISHIPEEFLYNMNRRKYGSKILVDPGYFREQIAQPNPINAIILMRRTNRKDTAIKRVGKLSVAAVLLRDMVVGIGLPQIIEYLGFEISLSGLLWCVKRFVRRSFIMIELLFKVKTYKFMVSYDNNESSQKLVELLEQV